MTSFVVTKNANMLPERRFIISGPVELGLALDELADTLFFMNNGFGDHKQSQHLAPALFAKTL